MPLFKYVPLERLDILKNQEIRYTQPGALNDPFEMSVFLEYLIEPGEFEARISANLPDFAAKEYEKLPPEQRARIPLADFLSRATAATPAALPVMYQAMQRLVPFVRAQLRRVDSEMGVLSLTATADNLLMWSHYAAQHRGMVIEFDERHPIFHERRTEQDDFRHLRPVVYSGTMPAITLDNFDVVDFILTKSSEWAYEREVRILKALSDSKRSISSIAPEYDIYLFDMPSTAVKRVILGARTTPSEHELVYTTIMEAQHLRHIAVQLATLNDRTFGLTFIDYR